MTGGAIETDPNDDTLLSVIVPVYNEEDVIRPFLDRLEPVLEGIAGTLNRPCEILFVDDGSSDGTLKTLLAESRRNPAVRIIALSRNFGKDVALTAGLDRAAGAAVVPIDVDLQDPPEVIGELFARWLEGFEVVYATRRTRKTDSFFKRLTARWFYRVHNRLADVDIPPDTGDFRLLDRRVVEALRQFPERNRFMKGLFAWVGFRQAQVTYDRAPREEGESKWKFWSLWNFGLDGITSSSTVPLRMWSYIGLGVSAFAMLYAVFLIALWLAGGIEVPGYASLMVVVLFLGGINLITLGVIGEYLGRTYTEVKGRPLYIVREEHGFDGARRETEEEWSDRSTSEWRDSRAVTGGS